MSCVSTILHIEDSDASAFLFRIALMEEQEESVAVFRVSDGAEALQFLQRISIYEHAPTPDVIVLDLNLPKMDGFGVLAALGQCRELAAIPVFILSTSGHPNDKRKSAELGVRKYFEKPNNFDDYADIIREICSPILERAA